MADQTYTIDVNTSTGQKNVEQLQKKVDKLKGSFDGLKSALAGIAFGAAVTGALKYADAVQDLSDATGIATNTILGFNKAIMMNGGDSEQANTSLLKFTQTIGSAADGAKDAQIAFSNVGVTLQDLQTLSEEDLLKKTVAGLNKIGSTTERMTAQVALFGKNARGVNFGGEFGAQFAKGSGDAEKYASAIKAGADAQQALDLNLKNLTTALLKVIEPFTTLISTINISVSAFQSLIKALLAGVATFLLFTRGFALINAAMSGWVGMTKAATGATMAFGAAIVWLFAPLGKIVERIGRMGAATAAGVTAFGQLGLILGGVVKFFARFAGVAGIVYTIVEAVNFLTKALWDFDILDYIAKKFTDVYNAARKFFNLSVNEGEKQKKLSQEELKQLHEKEKKIREVESAWKKQAEQIRQASSAFKDQNTDIVRAIGLEKELVGKSKEYTDLMRAQEEISNRAAGEIKKLQDAKAQLSKDDSRLASVYDEQIAKIQQIAQVDGERIASQIKGLNQLQNAEQLRLYGIQRQIEVQKQLQDLSDDYAKLTMTDIEKKYFDIGRAAENSAKMAIQAEEARRGSALSTEEIQAYYTKAYEGTGELIEQQKRLYDQSRSFSTGWTQAFNEYMDNATNAANAGRDIFNSVTSNMNSAIDKFVETGKFKFSDFARSVIQDLLKIELKAQATKLIGAATGGAGIIGGIASIFGFANGGNPPINRPSIVGEEGPEIFVPKTAGTVIPNGASAGGALGGGSVQNTYVTNNISALDAKSVAQLFAENRKTLLGSVQLAQKELPYGNR